MLQRLAMLPLLFATIVWADPQPTRLLNKGDVIAEKK
jgi:hypothetical protein